MGNPRNEQFIHFKLHTILSHVIKSPAVPLCPVWDVTYPFVQCLRAIDTDAVCHLVQTCLGSQTGCLVAVLVFRAPLFYFLMSPKCKSRDGGASDTPETP